MKKVCFYVAYVVLVLLLAELTLQGFYYATAGQFLFTRAATPIWVPEPLAGFGIKPNLRHEQSTSEFHTFVHTNSVGFRVSERHDEYPLAKAPGTFRAMLLGPSFAFGWGVNYEDTFAAKTAELLQRSGYAGGRPVEVLNAGVPSLGAVQQLRWYRQRGIEYRPDLVIQFVYGTLALPTDPDDHLAVDPEGYLVRRDASLGERLRGRVKKSAVVFYSWILFLRLEAALGTQVEETRVTGAGRELETHLVFDPEEPDVRASLAFYQDLRSTVESGGARLLVVYFPLSYCIHRQDMLRWKHQGVRDVDRQIAFDRAFCDFLRGRGLECLNLTEDLVRAAGRSPERLYYWLDIHWTPEGNRVAAEAVASYLLSTAGRERAANP